MSGYPPERERCKAEDVISDYSTRGNESRSGNQGDELPRAYVIRGDQRKSQEGGTQGRASRKARRGGYPSDSDPSSGDDDSDTSSDVSDSSFSEPLSNMVVPKTTQGGTTTTTIRPFVTVSSLDDFDEKASLSERTHWFSKEFKTKYCKSKKSDSEKYYTMKQRKQEDDWDDECLNTTSTKARDFRADNVHEALESPTTQEAALAREVSVENQVPSMTMEKLTQHVLKVMENSGWNKHGNMAHPGNARQNNDHPGSSSLRNCWADVIYEKCRYTGHPTQLCKTLSCKKCIKSHDGRCGDWEMLGRLLTVKGDKDE
ncbi:hypothetical protein PHMEG_00020845 [Phytophthora megakarya]|uniref:Uncharacterized protein n=1 Tax=Phytophthora megakarya TaxID=4795 RepID=A0A225VQN0_9STRA|nr:hypothetical protein PHMEG_00020845 [Phytophthora megakarya]